MKYLGWTILILELLGALVFHSYSKLNTAKAIVDVAYIIAGSSLIIIDRIKPNKPPTPKTDTDE